MITVLIRGIIAGVVVTIFTPKSKLNTQQALAKLNAERAAMESF
ncbi:MULTISPECIES: hypothetical protein [Thalassotalea]|uniref:YtxH domain-containing protein n=1 Tax=Thalassotalea castellviae TaxID=3075612 RepID=A0ABU3A1K9_9GAMM|nr:hypothetical protein [Thalassotalea sp. W431]MDT0604057.1 hypothetical protein [Thalassotalea sp. W431]